jgi:hypothetical protein
VCSPTTRTGGGGRNRLAAAVRRQLGLQFMVCVPAEAGIWRATTCLGAGGGLSSLRARCQRIAQPHRPIHPSSPRPPSPEICSLLGAEELQLQAARGRSRTPGRRSSPYSVSPSLFAEHARPLPFRSNGCVRGRERDTTFLRTTREGEWMRVDNSTRRTQLPTHFSDSLPKLAKPTQPLKCYWT